jgi:DNA-binding transcriptional LysR family regulator
MSDRLRELTAFVRAVETGSFSRVARELGVSQPSISRMVASLEARLDVKLLLRTTRRVAPTDAGRVFLERARQILGDLDDAENAARGVDSLRGTLRVALSSAFGIREVIPRLPGFAEQHPKLGIELLMSDRTEDLIAEGADVALRLGPLADSGFGAAAGKSSAPRRRRASLPRAQGNAADANRPCPVRLHSRPGSLRPDRLEFHALGANNVRDRAGANKGRLRRGRRRLRQSGARNSARLSMDVPGRTRGRGARRDPFRLST